MKVNSGTAYGIIGHGGRVTAALTERKLHVNLRSNIHLCAVVLGFHVYCTIAVLTPSTAYADWYCEQSASSIAVFTDNSQPIHPPCDHEAQAIVVDWEEDVECPHDETVLQLTVTPCGEVGATSGQVYGMVWSGSPVLLGSFSGNVWTSECDDWSIYDMFWIEAVDEISRLKLEVYCCDCSTCEPMDVTPVGNICFITGPWYWDGCDCVEFLHCMCVGDDCSNMYSTAGGCMEAYEMCPDC